MNKIEHTRTVLVTGGAGFIGSNLAARLLTLPDVNVRVLDNFSRSGVRRNAAWLQSLQGAERLQIIEADVRDRAAVERAVEGVSDIYHLAAQVAVTTSVEDPRTDFQVNAIGTFNVLEAARTSELKPFFLYTSTNKVYGSLETIPVQLRGRRYTAVDSDFAGVAEDHPLDFHSPYGCSKGAADQYVRDYARIYDLPTVVFRMSCIAGPRQFGNEDQGWVAHFLYSVLTGSPVTIYGDGHQVRDILHVQDLVDAMLAARNALPHTRGQVYNLGGGPWRAVSVLEMLQSIETMTGSRLLLHHGLVRPGDQPLYISDSSKLTRDTGWRAHYSLEETLDAIHRFWQENEAVLAPRFEHALSSAQTLRERELVAKGAA